MDELELCRLIDHKIHNGIGGTSKEITNIREDLMDRYHGELYGDERDGHSALTTQEVFEVVEWAMPAIMRVFESGERVAEFRPEGPQDELAAEQETDAVNYVYQIDNNGFVTTHNLVKSALLMPNSYVKVWRDETEETCTERYKNLNNLEIAKLLEGEGVEVVGQEQNEYGLWDIEVKITYTRGKNRVKCIPEEEIIVDSDHSELCLDDCAFVCHRTEKTFSQLIQDGYKKKDLEEVLSDEEYNSEEWNRRVFSDERDTQNDLHMPLKKFMVEECYMLVDWDGDDILERRFVVKIGNKIFENEEREYMPIASAVSILMPHRHAGLSLAQTVLELQRLKTFFTRQLANNMARVNNPRTLVTKGANLNDVLNSKNNFIRVNTPTDITTEPTQPVIGQVLPLLQLFDEMKENRTGITRNSMGLDADVLAKSTEGAFMGALEKAESRIENLIRLFAETVFKDIFLKIHHLLLTHGDTKYMQLGGQWQLVNPREWKKRETMRVNVGLGNGNRREKMVGAQMIIAEQDKLVAQGAMGVLVNQQNIYNARRLLVESVGQKNVDKYFLNPSLQPPPQPQPPQPDPNMLMIQSNERIEQGKRQSEMMKLQQEAQRYQAEFQLKMAVMQFDQAKENRARQFEQIELQYKRQIDELKASIDKEKVDNQAGAEALKAQIKKLEMQLEDAQADEKLEMERYKADLDAQTKILLKQMDGQKVQESHDLNLITKVLEQMNKPKRIVTDEMGNPIGVETV